ncbi:unannotated protein [freshwater metagenome]|uniref:Unannotated protein n=1 Tax=freshwater metagenome TaxID=449393 RepID=A0A6J6DD64_9ZZZZ
MRLVHDDVAGFKLQRVDDVLASLASETFRAAIVVGRRAPVELAFGQQCERGIRDFEAVLEVGLHQIGDALFEAVRQGIHNSTGQCVLGEHLLRAFDEAVSGSRDDNRPTVAQFFTHVLNGTVDVARKARNGIAGNVNVVVIATVERAQCPPWAVSKVGANLSHRQEIAGREINRRCRTHRGGVPRGVKKLPVRFTQVDGSRCNALGRDHGDGGRGWQVLGQRNQFVDECRCQRLHALDGDPLANFAEHSRHRRKLMFHLACPLTHRVGQQQLSRRRQDDPLHLAVERPLICHREPPHGFEFIAEKVQPHRMLGHRREHVQDSAAHGKLASARDNVNTRVGQVHEPSREVVEVVTSRRGHEGDRLDLKQVARDGLKQCPHRRENDQRLRAVPRGDASQCVESPTRDFGARTQSFVGQGFPRGKLQNERAGL